MTLQIYNKQQYQKIEVQEQRTKPNLKKTKGRAKNTNKNKEHDQ